MRVHSKVERNHPSSWKIYAFTGKARQINIVNNVVCNDFAINGTKKPVLHKGRNYSLR